MSTKTATRPAAPMPGVVTTPTPYVLLNYQPNLSSVLTLAHEMGHALHSAYSNAHQPYIYAQYPIILAEVASTVNEVLMMEDLLLETTDPKVRLYLLNRFLEEFRGRSFGRPCLPSLNG